MLLQARRCLFIIAISVWASSTSAETNRVPPSLRARGESCRRRHSSRHLISFALGDVRRRSRRNDSRSVDIRIGQIQSTALSPTVLSLVSPSTSAGIGNGPTPLLLSLLAESQHSASPLTLLQPSLYLLRGGAAAVTLAAPSWLLLLAKMFVGYALAVGIFVLLAPLPRVAGLVGFDDASDEEDNHHFESTLIKVTGAIQVGFALHMYLTLVCTANTELAVCTVEQAMGYSLIPRILATLWYLIREGTGTVQFGGSNFLKMNFAVMCWTAVSLLSGLGNPTLSTKVFSCLALVKGLVLVVRPVEMTYKVFHVDVSGEDMMTARFLSKSLGTYLVTSAVLMLTLAFGANAFLGAGIAAAVWFLLLVDTAFVSKSWKWLAREKPTGISLVNIGLAAFFVVAFVLGVKI